MKKIWGLFICGIIVASSMYLITGDMKEKDSNKTVLELHRVSYVENLKNNGNNEAGSALHIEKLEKDNEFLKSSDTTIPSSYSSDDKGYVTSAKNQGDHGTCWAFSAISAIESNLILKKLADNTIDLSEGQLAYFAYNRPVDKMNLINNDIILSTHNVDYLHLGGNYYVSSFALGIGIGVTDETVVPYNSLTPTTKLNDSLAYDSKYIVKNNYMLNMGNKTVIKRAIMEYGSVTAAYKSDGDSYNYSVAGAPAYYQNDSTICDHAITIIGWDDHYSKSKFLTTPAGDGAWLVKNSWGSAWGGNKGYFWLSYYDTSLLNSLAACYDVEVNNENYLHRYQYDGNPSLAYFTDVNYQGNVYIAQSLEKITDVGFMSDANDISYKIYVYKNVKTTPSSGDLIYTQTGKKDLAGQYIIKLNKEIPINKGEKFAVVVQAVDSYGTPVGIFVDESDDWDWVTYQSNANVGESYVSYNNENWIDLDKDYNCNCRIKVLTKEENTAFFIDKESPQKVGRDIVLSVVSRKTNISVKYQIYNKTLSEEKIIDYSSNMKYTWRPSKPGEYIITAYVKDNNTGLVAEFKKDYTIGELRVDNISNMSIYSRTESEVTLKWDKMSDVTGYEIFVYKNKVWYTIGKVDTNYCTVTNLVAGKENTIGVKAYLVEGGTTYYSDEMNKIITWTAPANTSSISVTNRTSSQIDFKWTSVAGATGYYVYMFTGGKWNMVKDTTGTTYSATGLNANGNYGFYVKAYRKDSQGVAVSSMYTSKYIYTAPGITSNITTTLRNANKISISWSKVTGATGYQIYMMKNGAWTKVATQAGMTYTASNLSTGSNNGFMIKAYRTDSDGTAISTTNKTKYIYTAPGVTSKTDLSSLKSTSVKIAWAKVKNASGYRVYVKKNKGKYTAVSTLTGTSYTVSGLSVNTKYTIAVKAYRKDSDGVVWASSYKTASLVTAPGVTSKIATTRSKNAIKLTWNAVSGAKGYRVYIKKGNKWVTLKNTTGRTYTVKGLKRRTSYQFAVKAYTKSGTKVVWSSSYKTVKASTK